MARPPAWRARPPAWRVWTSGAAWRRRRECKRARTSRRASSPGPHNRTTAQPTFPRPHPCRVASAHDAIARVAQEADDVPVLIDMSAPLQLYLNRGALHYHLPVSLTDDDDVWRFAPTGVPAPSTSNDARAYSSLEAYHILHNYCNRLQPAFIFRDASIQRRRWCVSRVQDFRRRSKILWRLREPLACPKHRFT